MKVSLLTDAPKHNLALMKISWWHKHLGDEVTLNMPLWKADKTYASVLFDWNKNKFVADEYGGPAFGGGKVFSCPEDYSLFNINYSLGYTYRYCPRGCPFCKVKELESDQHHYSIWKFHNSQFNKICLLNNNTFFDPQWRETFKEVWEANLIWKDDSGGFDLRLIDEEKAEFLKKTKWDHGPKFAWDRMQDEEQILNGLNELLRQGIKRKTVYVLIGFDTTINEDIYRCQKLEDFGFYPFPMIYKETDITKRFRRMIYLRYYRKVGSIVKAWKEYLG
jgi:hypothetical protein